MNPIIFEKNTEPEMRACLNALGFKFVVIWQGYAMVQTKRRVKYVCIIQKIVEKHQQVKVFKQTTFDYE